MRIAVINLVTGNLDILMLSDKAEKAFNESYDARDFFESLDYDYDSIDWGEIKHSIKEEHIDVDSSGDLYFKDV